MSISVIVPYFNAQNYLAAFVHDLIAQSFTDFEVIFVDDGSTDNSLMVLKQELAPLQLAVKLLQQTHKGVSAARNLGLRHAEKNTSFSVIVTIIYELTI